MWPFLAVGHVQKSGTKFLKIFFTHVPTSWGHVKKSGTKFLKIFCTHVPTSWGHVKKSGTKFLKKCFPQTYPLIEDMPELSELPISGQMDAQPSGRRKTWCQETLCHLSQGTGWYLASWSCLCSGAEPPTATAVPQHSTAQAWPTGQIPSSALAQMT